jgi:cytochrome c oxidase subunit II
MEWLADPASGHGFAMREAWLIFIGAGTFVGLYVYACVGWCLIAYRRRANRTPSNFDGNSRLEMLYVALPIAIVIVLFAVTAEIEMPIDRVSAAPSNRVAVTAFRWSWRFEYPNGATTVGTPGNPPTLYLPEGETTEIDLRSADVTHSFWVPAFLFKRDAIPGMTNAFDLDPDRLGRFPGRCAQFCGLDHALMTFVVAVVSRAAYQRYLSGGTNVAP